MSFAISMEEARLIARLRRGEREALSGLQEEWRDEVWTLCLAMTRSEREAQLLVQGVWKAFRDEVRTWSAHAPLSGQVAGLVCRGQSPMRGAVCETKLRRTRTRCKNRSSPPLAAISIG